MTSSTTHRPQWWLIGWPTAGQTAELAAVCEAGGWDGLLLPDTQCLAHDSYVEIAMCAARTNTLGLGMGVTNPVTRDPAVTASAIGTLQAESGGRMHLGIGRGDSSLGHRAAADLPAADREAVTSIAQRYDMREHASSRAAHALAMPDAFVERFAIAGDADRVRERLLALAATGVDRIVLIPGSRDADADAVRDSLMTLSTRVLPALRS